MNFYISQVVDSDIAFQKFEIVGLRFNRQYPACWPSKNRHETRKVSNIGPYIDKVSLRVAGKAGQKQFGEARFVAPAAVEAPAQSIPLVCLKF